jgi:arginase
MLNKNFTFIEAPIYQGQKNFGVSLGPSFIRQLLLDQNFHFDLLSTLVRQSQTDVNEAAYEELSYLVEREARRKKLLFIAGGDHSLSIGSVQGLLRCYSDLKVIWIDAHGDINTQASSMTKAFHGMPLSFLLGLDQRFEKTDWFDCYLKPENLIYFGLRDLDPAEKNFLLQNKIQYFTNTHMKTLSLEQIMSEVQNKIKGQPVHISIDTDAYDPSVAPSTGVPVGEGFLENEVDLLVQKIAELADIKSFEFVELNPQIFKAPADVFRTAQLGIDLFKKLLEKHKNKGALHGCHDRFSYSEKPSLFDSHFELEKQS